MRAVTISGGNLVVADRPDPVPGAGELLVRVRAAGLNAADMMQRRGFYPAPPGSPADIPGLELAGEVVAGGPGTSRFTSGDRVMAVVGGGGQAEMCIVHERHAIPVPENVSWPEAGGFPEAFTTAHDAMFSQAGLQAGERVLVHGAAGGVGVAGVQIAVAAGCEVVATVRNEAMRERVAGLGAQVVAPDDFDSRGPFDVVLELVGAPNMAGNLKALATGGRICVIGIGGGPVAELNLGALMGTRGRIHGSTLRTRSLEDKALAARRLEKNVLPLLAAGRVRVPVEETFPVDQAETAYDRFAAGGKFGKVVLVP